MSARLVPTHHVYRDRTDDRWMLQARCRNMNPDLFFGQGDELTAEEAARAKAVCRNCPVVEPCVRYAAHHHCLSGIFGGLAPKERRGLYLTRTEAREEACG